MKKLCIGTYIHLICQAKPTSITQKDFLTELLTFSNEIHSDYAQDPTLHGHLKNGTDNMPVFYANIVRNTDPEELFRHFANNIVPLLDVHKYKQLILAFRSVIREDSTIPDDCLIGTSEGYTKSDILSKSTFSLPCLLTNLFIYCTTQAENKKFKNNIKEIPSNFVDSFNDEIRSINICESLPITPVPIESTVRREKFDSVFTEVIHPQTLNLPNPSTVKLYHLNVADYSFTHDQISKFIKDNLGRYVFSRAKRNEYQINDEIENIALDAATAMRKSGEIPTASHFGEIMLYSFLESVLNAPKLMSKVELQNAGGGYTSKCSGVHLLSLDNGKLPIYQLVFGCTDTLENLTGAIDSAFKQLVEIKTNSAQEHTLIESNILNTTFSQAETEFLTSTILPQKNKPKRPDTAFGLFLGYNVCVPNGYDLPSDEYLSTLMKQLTKDITDSVPYIQSKIEQLKLKQHSFYIFVLPLNDINADRTTIMNKALGV